MESYKRREEEEGSASSALSAHSHSHRHLPDLDEDDSACEEELARLAAQVIVGFINPFFIFTLYTVNASVGRRNLLRHCIPHFIPNFRC